MHFLGFYLLLLLLLGHHFDGVDQEEPKYIVDQDAGSKDTSGKTDTQLLNLSTFRNKLNQPRSNVKPSIPFSSVTSPYHVLYVNFATPCKEFYSCASRCRAESNFRYACNCDSLCQQFSDCCMDYEEYCTVSKRDVQTGLQLPKLNCSLLFTKYSVLTVTQCPASFPNAVVKQLCSVKVPKECMFLDTFNESHVATVIQQCEDFLYYRCMKKLSVKCNEVLEPRCTSGLVIHCKKYASSFCRRCSTHFWPVFDAAGVIYRNSHCAQCNSHNNYRLLTPNVLSGAFKAVAKQKATNDSPMIRRCAVNAMDTCSSGKRAEPLDYLCLIHSGAVMTKDKKPKVYKNLYCALCNGEQSSNLTCAPSAYVMHGRIKTVVENFISGEVDGMKFDDIPAAFSILLNFGLDGRQRMYISSEGEDELKEHECALGMIWDPFSQICRKIYCSTEFVLVDYHCVRKETVGDLPIPENETGVIPDAQARFVHLSLSAEMEILDFLQFNGLEIKTICDMLQVSLASSFNINIDRIRNVAFNISVGVKGGLNETLEFIEEMDDLHPICFKIDFNLYENNNTDVKDLEPSVDIIVSMLASSLSMNGFEFDVNNVTSRIFEIHQSVSPLVGWCTAPNQEKKKYKNSEFKLIFDGEYSSTNASTVRGILVNETGKFYPKGKFVADILFQGYQFKNSLVNVSGVAVVCETVAKLNESCMRVLIEPHEYVLENGSLYVHNQSLRKVVDDSLFEEHHNGSIWVCLKSLQFTSKKYRFDMDFTEAYVSLILLWISVFALTVVLLTFVCFSSLRNVPGCNTMNLTLSLLAMQLTFIFGERGYVTGIPCMVVAHLLHYEILCCFTWMNVMAFDLFQTFGNWKGLSNIRCKGKFLPRYMAYAYLSPLTVVVASSLLDVYLPESPLAPRYGADNVCWITTKYSAVVFFATPLAVIMCVNLIFFILTVSAMRGVKNVAELSDQKAHRRGQSDLLIYSKMAFVVGFTWALSFAAAFVKDNALIGRILTYLFIIFNTLQGVFICWAFVCNQKVYQLYKKAFNGIIFKVKNPKRFEGSSETIRRLALVMKRTISSDTVVSTLSGVSSASEDSQLATIKES